MPIRFDKYASITAKRSLRIALSSDAPLPNDLFSIELWSIYQSDGESDWALLDAYETIRGINLDTTAGEALIVRLQQPIGLYKLVCSASFVETGYDFIYARFENEALFQPYLRIEGLNFEDASFIPSTFFNADSLPSSLSQQLEPQARVARFGALELSLVDIDDKLTAAFAPRLSASPIATLDDGLTKTGLTLTLADAPTVDDEGILYIDNEAIAYSGVTGGDTLSITARGALSTNNEAHEAGAKVYLTNPYLIGRRAWLLLRDSISGDEHCLYSGQLAALSVQSDNLAAYRVTITDTLQRLETKLSVRMGRAEILDALMVTKEDTRFGARGNDTLYFRFKSSPSSHWSYRKARVKVGAYLSDKATQAHPMNIAKALESALQAAEPSIASSVVIDNDGFLQLRFKVNGALQLLPARMMTSDRDSILESLGMPEAASEIMEHEQEGEDGNGFTRFSISAKKTLVQGLAPNASKIYLQASPNAGQNVNGFANGNLVCIDNELIYYRSTTMIPDNFNTQSTLSVSMDATDSALRLEDASHFPEDGGFIEIGGERIAYAARFGNRTLLGLSRGVFSTSVQPHNSGDTVTLLSFASLNGIVRGMYATEIASHDGGTLIEEALTSDELSYHSPEAPDITPSAPIDFLLSIISQEDSRYACRLQISEDDIDAASFSARSEELAPQVMQGFRRIAFQKESFRDIFEDVLGSIDCYLYANKEGQLALGRFQPILAHNKYWNEIDDTMLLDAPKPAWREDLRTAKIEMAMDYDTQNDAFQTRIVVHGDDADRFSPYARSLQTTNIQSKSLISKSGQGNATAAKDWLLALAKGYLSRYNRFLTSLHISLLARNDFPIHLFHQVSVTYPALPLGDGQRGVTKMQFDVMEYEHDLVNQQIHLGLLERSTSRYVGIAPSLRITAYEATEREVSVSPDAYWPEDIALTEIFSIGDVVSVQDVFSLSSGVYRVSLPLVIETITEAAWPLTDGAIRFTTTPSFSLSAGDILMPVAFGEQTSSLSKLNAFCYLADEQGSLGDADEEGYHYSY